ncbi:MAG: hypothetical protein WKG07_40655 [Hymenobacter sp.]
MLVADPDRGLLMATEAADRDLPGLAALHDRRRQRLLRRLLGQHELMLDGLQLRTLRHNPHRRWVGTLSATDGPQALLRVYRPDHRRSCTDAIAALARSDLGTPRLLGLHKRLGVVAMEFLPGATLAGLGHPDDPGRDCAGIPIRRRGSGAAACLHRPRTCADRRHRRGLVGPEVQPATGSADARYGSGGDSDHRLGGCASARPCRACSGLSTATSPPIRW